MKKKDVLTNKHILAVDDRADILDYIEQELHMCLVDKAIDYQTALEYMQGYTYDIVVLDIMGVDGFRLLELAVGKDFPTVMLTPHALNPEALEKSVKLGAASFLPKDRMSELKSLVQDVVLGSRKEAWRKVIDKLSGCFGQRFGSDWIAKNMFLQDFEEELKKIAKMDNPSIRQEGSITSSGRYSYQISTHSD